MNRVFRLFLFISAAVLLLACEGTGNQTYLPGSGTNTEGGNGNNGGSENGGNTGGGSSIEIPNLGTLNVSKLTATNHPRLIFTDADFAAIKAGGQGNLFNTIHNQIITKADGYVNASELVRVIPDGKRLLAVSRNALERLSFCAYAYKVTGQTKYLIRVEKDLTAVCNFTDWNAKKHFLDVGEMAAGVGLAYDWLYSDLKNETKVMVRNALKKFAFEPAQNKVWNLDFYKAENNWNQVCNGGLITAALAVYEDNPSQAKDIIQKGVESNYPVVQALYSPDGSYPEGYSYWCYGTIYQVLILAALESSTGSDLNLSRVPGFSKTGKYMLFMEGYLDMCFNFSDSTPPVVPALSQWYFAHKFNDVSTLYIEKNRISTYKSAAESRLLPLVAYYAYKLNLSSLDSVTKPEENVWCGKGTTPVVLVHDNWTMDATDKFLGMKGGKANTSHGHMDAGSFVYEAFGVRWADDMARPGYANLESKINLWNMNDGSERWDVAQYANRNHNTLTVNEKEHKAGGVASILEVINSNGRKGGVVDITNALGNEVASAVRTIYIEGDDLVVTDEIKASSSTDAKVEWVLVGKNTVQKAGAVLELKNSLKNKYLYLKKSSETNHNPVWFIDEGKITDRWVGTSDYYRCGYKLTVKKGSTAKVTIRLTPNY